MNGPKLSLAERPTHLLSVVVPVIRHREGLARCLESVRVAASKVKAPQLDSQFKFILKDSAPQTDPEVRQLADQFGFTRVVTPHKEQMADSWNDSVEFGSTGRYVHVMHDDDWLRPDFYSLIWPHLTVGCLAVSTGYEREEADGHVSFENRIDREGDGSGILAKLERGNPFVPSAVVVSTEAYRLVGGYVAGTCSDWDLYLRIASIATCNVGRFWPIVPELLVRQVNGKDADSNREGGRVRLYAEILATIERHEGVVTDRKMEARDTYSQSAWFEAFSTGDEELFRLSRKIKGMT